MARRVTIAHRVEVEVSADGRASAPPSGATEAAPPAGANLGRLQWLNNCECTLLWSEWNATSSDTDGSYSHLSFNMTILAID
jgi:hypothetical protein